MRTKVKQLEKRAKQSAPDKRRFVVCWCLDPNNHDEGCPALNVEAGEVVRVVNTDDVWEVEPTGSPPARVA